MTVVAMSHEIGTFGQRIATELGQRLDLDFADARTLEARIGERLLRSTGQFTQRATGMSTLRVCLGTTDRTLARHAAEEIAELAAYGKIVIRGWGAASLLRHTPHVVRIRLRAQMDYRLRALAPRYPGCDTAKLMQVISESEASMAANLEPVMGPDWRTGDFYHLVVDVDDLPVRSVVEQIERCIAVQRLSASLRKPAAISRTGDRKVQRQP